MNRYIFPNGELPTLSQITMRSSGCSSWRTSTTSGWTTVGLWRSGAEFRAGWHEIRRAGGTRFDERFFRMWIYFLSTCRGSLRARNMHLWHVVMSKGLLPSGVSVRPLNPQKSQWVVATA